MHITSSALVSRMIGKCLAYPYSLPSSCSAVGRSLWLHTWMDFAPVCSFKRESGHTRAICSFRSMTFSPISHSAGRTIKGDSRAFPVLSQPASNLIFSASLIKRRLIMLLTGNSCMQGQHWTIPRGEHSSSAFAGPSLRDRPVAFLNKTLLCCRI